MQEIDFEEFKQRGGSPVTAAASDERTFFQLNENELGVLAKYEDKDGTTFRASVLRPSSYFDGEFRTDESEFNTGSTEKSIERAKESSKEWLVNQT